MIYNIKMTDSDGLVCNIYVNNLEQLKQEIADAVTDGFIEYKIIPLIEKEEKC